jgi:hypothetical protein
MSATPQADRLQEQKNQWDQFVLDLPDDIKSAYGADILTVSIPEWFLTCWGGVRYAETQLVDPVMKELTWPLIIGQISGIDTHMQQFRTNGSAWFFANQIPRAVLGLLWEIRKLLAWVTPDLTNAAVVPAVSELMANAQLIYDAAHKTTTASREALKSQEVIGGIEAKFQEAVTRIQGHEREASNAQSNATASASAATQAKGSVDELVSDLSGDVGVQKDLIAEFERNRDLVEQTLQGASKIGLAKSFSARRESLERSQGIWGGIFVGGLCLLLIGAALPLFLNIYRSGSGTESLAPAFGEFSSASSPSALGSVLSYLSHVLIFGPGIWLTWFAARKYGQLSRLAEDYAFKEASALAFVGYRSEMGEDKEMLDLLRRTAIENFGANPVRVLADDEPASPVHDALVRVLKKTSPDKLAELLKEGIKTITKSG